MKMVGVASAGRPLSLDIVVPAVRRATTQRLVASLTRNPMRPDAVTIVSNEVERTIETGGLDVRILRFRSEKYPIGDRDVALRRNVGIWSSDCTHVLMLDDDLVAPPNLIETSLALLRDNPYFWGHHRYISFSGYPLERLMELAPELGRRREDPPNSWHLWMSCYAGLFGAERETVVQAGGFDLIFSGRHGGEDQSLGKRLAAQMAGTDRVFIHEPPFAWHPAEPDPWDQPAYTNLCPGAHRLEERSAGGVAVSACRRCPYFVALDDSSLFGDDVVLPFDPAEVEVTLERPSRGESDS